MDLDIEGRHALLFDDDASAAFVNSRAALVPWTGDESLLIDRYDVRHLLDRIPPRPKKQRFVEDTGGVSLSELHRERFLDLPLVNDGDGDDNEIGTTERSEATGSGSYQAVPFSYGNNDGSADPNSCGLNHSAFHPPFSVPIGLLNNLPPTEKLHHIMARTAIFVREHGGQSEIVLRVKQGDNPTFGFLIPDNQLHPYFRFLVDHPQLLKIDSTHAEKKSVTPESEALAAAGGALSLLGSVYGTGEDDDNAPQQESNEGEASKLNTDVDSVLSHKSVNEESASSVSLEDKESVKHAVVAPTKEKILIPKRNHFANSGSISKKIEATTSLHGFPDRHSNQPGKTDAKPLIMEPPSFLKRTMEKIVEFILRNGKEFEAVLIEQDKTAGRFPFLLASNQYHSYYLKVLQEALESKSLSKNPSEGSKRRVQEAAGNESPAGDEFESWSLDPQRKEKFKMVIGSKKESTDQPKPVKRTAMTADEVAAIVLSATRGRSPAFQTTSAADSDTGRASSLGSLSLNQPHKPTSKPATSNGEAGNVAVATAIAKTAALATASEADSSDAALTKEQKLKAERLRRAKMFAAMIKSGSNPTTQSVHSGGTPSGCAVHSGGTPSGCVVPTTAGSNHEEREGSCVPFDAEAFGKERNYRKRHNSRSKEDEDEDDSDVVHKHLSKKHRSDDHKHGKCKESRHGHSHRHHKHLTESEDEYKHEKSHHHHHPRHKRHSDSENEDRHGKNSRHRQHSDSENEDGHGKSLRHRCQHRKRYLSEDENLDRSCKHRRKHRAPSQKGEELEEGEFREKSLDKSEGKPGDHVSETVSATVSDAKPSDLTEVPSDLRAKIRAMLLETI